MRAVLVGAVESTRVAFEILLAEGAAPVAVVTLPLVVLRSRHSDAVDLRPLAEKNGIPLIEARDINTPDVIASVRRFEPDYIFVIGWSQICRGEFLRTARRGCIGYHPAPLPKNRGRAVIPWTILQGARTTGSTLFWMDEGLDSGDILVQEEFEVAPDETAKTLYEKHLDALARLLRLALKLIRSGTPPRRPQDHNQATYCSRRVPRDGLIDWTKPAREVWTLIRAVTRPYPGAFTFRKKKKLFIWSAKYVGSAPFWGLPGQVQEVLEEGALVQCGDSEHVLLTELQEEGGPVLPASLVLKRHERLGLDLLEVLEICGFTRE